MKKLFSSRWFLLCLRFIIGGVFIYAGALKMRDPLAFADSIVTFQMVPKALISILALTLPPLEIMAGLLLISGWRARSGAFCILLLTAGFSLALGQALFRGLQVDCGCFGSGAPSVYGTWISFGRAIALLAATAWIYVAMQNRRTAPHP